jgi:hypothetical protein
MSTSDQHPSVLGRRAVLKGAGVLGLAAAGVRPAPDAAADQFASVILPPDIGQSERQVYIRETGHTLRGSMLDYWRATGGAHIYGNPISEPFASFDGYYSQAFERAVFQYRWEFQDTEDPIMRLMPIGRYAFERERGALARTGRRIGGGGDRRKGLWRALDPGGGAVQRALDAGGFFDESTGHTVSGAFAEWYWANEGAFYLGSPLSQPLHERGTVVQYFEGGLLARDTNDVVRLVPLARELARDLGIDTTPVDRGKLPHYDETLFIEAPNPNPIGDPWAAGRRWIEISIGQQTLWAYQGWTPVLQTLVSTGLSPNDTPTGLFHIRLKFPKQTMSGFTDSTGEVVGFGDEAPAGVVGATSYEVKDVPDVMYFTITAAALHGAYWHNNFGAKMSHGCVNLPLPVAAWMYGWAPLGTMVWVRD